MWRVSGGNGVTRWRLPALDDRSLPRPGIDGDAPWGPRLVLASGVLLGIVYLLALHDNRPYMLGVNTHVYYLAGVAVASGGDLYAVAPPGFSHLPYVYPPIVAVAFLPYALLGSPSLAFAAHTGLTVVGGVVLAGLLVRLAERGGRRLARVDRLLIAAFVVGSVHTAPSLFYGNVNLLLVLALAAAVVQLDRSPAVAGALYAVPAVVKVFPALFGLWLLRRRAWRAVGGAVATGLAVVAASFAAFGVGAHRDYVVEALLPRRRSADFVGGLDPNVGYLTLRRPVSILLPDADPVVLALLTGLALAPVAAYLLAADVDRAPGDLIALHGTVAATLLFFPSYQTYFVFLFVTLVPLLYELPPGGGRRLIVAGGLVANLAISPASVRGTLGPPLVEPVMTVLGPVLAFGSPRLYGVLLTLAACVYYRRQHVVGAGSG